ncbi:MAG: diguanylate cyclase [Clostridiales bacterium]|nr:diguanylate cyclase [Clostridiales bacterium]
MQEKKYDERLNRTLTFFKVGYFFISGLIIIRGVIEQYTSGWSDQKVLILSVAAAAFAVVVSYLYAWTFLKYRPRETDLGVKRLLILESYFLLIVSVALIWFTDKNYSYFLVAALLFLIPVTIQIGLRQAYLIIAFLSVYIFALDFIYSYFSSVARFLEKDLVSVAVLFLTTWVLDRFVKTDRERILALEERANIDGLSGLYNHRYFHNALNQEIKSCLYLKQPLTLLFLDIDSFKEFNDQFGHLNGDKLLSTVARLMVENKPNGAILARYGGDEFAAILPNLSKEDGRRYGEKIRQEFQDLDLREDMIVSDSNEKDRLPEVEPMTLSVGIAQWNNRTENALNLIKNADDALYRAKLFRKNRVEIYDSIIDTIELGLEKDDYDLLSSLQALINIINARDRYTSGHVERVVMYSKALARQLDLCEEDCKSLSLAAYMHDIGKVNLSEKVLNKESPLDEKEWSDIKDHSVVGAHILREVAILAEIAPLVLHHHERYDGKGYPNHLKGKEIPYLSRVLTVVDSFDAMTFDRPYKAGMNWEEAIVELRANKGTQFDPDIVEVFVGIIEESLKKNPDNKRLND